MGDLVPILVQQGYIEYSFQLVTGIIADIGLRSLGFQEIVPLFPDADGMGLNSGKILKVFDGKCVHSRGIICLIQVAMKLNNKREKRLGG